MCLVSAFCYLPSSLYIVGGGRIGTKMPLNHISCHWIIDAMSLDQTSFYPTIFFMSLDRMSFYRTIFFMSLDRTSCHWIGLHAIGSNFMPLDRTSCHWIGLHVIGSDFMLLDRTLCYWILSFFWIDFISLEHFYRVSGSS